MKRHVRHVLKDENPTIWVGKEGLTLPLAAEIEKQLQRNKMVKGEVTAQAIGLNAAGQTNSALVEVRGHVFILFRKRKAEEECSQP
jgi:RNA-binding protein YhbY